MMNQGMTSTTMANQGSMNFSNMNQNNQGNTDWPKKRVGSGNFSALDAVLDDGNLVEVIIIARYNYYQLFILDFIFSSNSQM